MTSKTRQASGSKSQSQTRDDDLALTLGLMANWLAAGKGWLWKDACWLVRKAWAGLARQTPKFQFHRLT